LIAGRLNKQITIQQVTETKNSFGEVSEAWSTYNTVWAEIKPISGKEYFNAESVQSEVTHKIKTRYLSGITTKMRISYDSRVFDIETVINIDERSRYIEMMCTENVD